jgi:hypothetical protein
MRLIAMSERDLPRIEVLPSDSSAARFIHSFESDQQKFVKAK